jgi:hypothetical protein
LQNCELQEICDVRHDAAGKLTCWAQKNLRESIGKSKLSKGMTMTSRSKILVAYTAALGLSAFFCTPVGAQSNRVAPAAQCDGNFG